jgi:hypothetical protein
MYDAFAFNDNALINALKDALKSVNESPVNTLYKKAFFLVSAVVLPLSTLQIDPKIALFIMSSWQPNVECVLLYKVISSVVLEIFNAPAALTALKTHSGSLLANPATIAVHIQAGTDWIFMSMQKFGKAQRKYLRS